ncbi:alpha/beta fold hydrolase [Hymenobacter psychrophilus]|uniref:Pimeloyl-ACP methyl ester carboxylesterase n=1 Tax=Hymenobacter psychrophilus TaxID=651662 RepID=A0A1H3HZC8_9BACT|nr:alpha/beta hydrolase [Hymenobacter psychrophilus]SDY20826.1 Pimeloyl-ACP methyl ester carboxylesterase [Hymenobacter psychrophilus]
MPNTLTFLALHYWAGAGHEFDQLANLLRPDYRLLAPDLGGFGGAPAPARGFSVSAYADAVAAFMEAEKLTRYVLVGHSMGGKIALELAARQPVGLVGVVLLSPSPPSPEPMTDEDRQTSLQAWGKPAEAEKTVCNITARPLPEATHRQVVADNLASSRAAWEAWLLRGSREDISARVSQIRVPCALVAGDQDAVLSPSVHGLETLPLLPPDTPLEIVAGAGHLLPYEAPQEVAALLRRFASERIAE